MPNLKLVAIQPAQTEDVHAEYDPHLPLPYPWLIEPDGDVARQDFWRGEPLKLLGFQRSRHEQEVSLLAEDWLAGDPQAAVGLWPVFLDADGGMWNDARPIASVTSGA